mgnify:CR=1 FL=1
MNKEKINEDYLCVLRKDRKSNQVEIDYFDIESPLTKSIESFINLCENDETTLTNLICFLENTPELNQLSANYSYCLSLTAPYEGVSANNQKTIKEIQEKKDKLKRIKVADDDNNKEKKKEHIKNQIDLYKKLLKEKYFLWNKAFAMNKVYRLCKENSSILTFSHRIVGWADPVYKLTNDFSLQFKTNFGYGNASYFYTLLKYKNIIITPFSEWIHYKIVRISELIQYTKSHILLNESWYEAMVFARDACNLSQQNEEQFIDKYIISECEEMVNGLEEMFKKDQFTFRERSNNGILRVGEKEQNLVELRGYKISGALDFIYKILEFDEFTSVRSFINRIELCNKRIQPLLSEESEVIKAKLSNYNEELSILKPKYEKKVKGINEYKKKGKDFKRHMLNTGQYKDGKSKAKTLNKAFAKKYPEYKEFLKEYKDIDSKYKELSKKIHHLEKIHRNIDKYYKKIDEYFLNN